MSADLVLRTESEWIEVTIFGATVRATNLGAGPDAWFVAADVCRAAGTSASNLSRRVPAEEMGSSSIRTLGGPQTMVTVNRAGFFRILLDGRKPEARSRVGNGSSLFLAQAGGEPLDGRTLMARVFRDTLDAFVGDLGGRDAISEAEYQLARRAAAVSVECLRAETYQAAGRELDIDAYVKAVGALNRALLSIGLQRRPKDVSALAGLFEEMPGE